MSAKQSISILIVEDEAIVALDLKLQLLGLGYQVQGIAASGEQALAQVAKQLPHLILMDIRIQGPRDGVEVAAEIRRDHDVPVIFLTSHSDDATVGRAAQTAPYGYLTKPYEIRQLRAGVEVALTKARLERQLREADRWFANTLQCVTDGIIVTDQQGAIRFLNPEAERLTGWKLEDCLGLDVGKVARVNKPDGDDLPLHRFDPSAMIRTVLTLRRPAPVSHALRLLSRDGTSSIIDETVGPVADDFGKPLGAVVVLHDASARVAQESLLRDSEERFRSAFDHAPLGMALIALSGNVLQVNDAFCQMLGTGAAELLGRDHGAFSVEADRDHETLRLRELDQRSQSVVQYEKRYKRAFAEPIWTLVSVSMLRHVEQPTCYLFQIHDLTEQKKAAEHLAELAAERIKRQASELADAAKTAFLSRASHEMRTPLNAVIGFSSILQELVEAQEGKTRQFASQIRNAGEHLLAMVNDLLDLNRVSEGTLNFELETLVLAAQVEEALEMMRVQSSAQEVRMEVSVPAPLLVRADSVRLRQVLLNVLSNAVKYNRHGGSVKIHAEALPEGWVRLAVEDSGIGMTARQLERLFQPFDRLGRERTTTPGTGLGLTIAQGLVARMSGRLTVTSRPDVGTCMTIDLPAAV